MFAFITHMRAKPGKRDALIELTGMLQAQTATEAGVPVYAFHTAADSPDDFWFYDLYETEAAHETHCATPAFQSMMQRFGELADMVQFTKLVPYGPIKSQPVSEPPS